jgi:cell division protein FtsI (penicillin-binding protein 3)
MAKPATRIGLLELLIMAGLAAVVVRAAQYQLIEREHWAAVAERTRTAPLELPARRGTLYDRDGMPLAVSQEFYRVGVAPWEVPRALRDTVARLLVRQLDFAPARVRTAFRRLDPGQDYLYRYAPASASEVEALRRYRGVHLERIYRRAYPSGRLARDLIGTLTPETNGGSTGLELSLDALLTGRPGLAIYLRDRSGRLYESPDRRVREPVAGHDVVLTLDAELQGIAEARLAQTLDDQDADAGDVVLVDPWSGEILALATHIRRPAGVGARRAGAWIPAEPGSTIKPFAAAALLALRRVQAGDSVSGEQGAWVIEGRSRPVRDDHPQPGYLTLARAIEVSSNIATTKFTLRLAPEEHFDVLRDFGFGTPTGVELPYESPGLLKRPHTWQRGNTQPSMAQGYELEVTPLQLAAAYAALAAGGVLPALTLVREVRDAEGRVVYRHLARPVRRVVSEEVAAEVRSFLRLAASSGGTGGRAQLDRYEVIGKTGTARTVVDGRYTTQYTASFAGIFPADDPQLVAVIRISNPRAGLYYGGLVAAPLLRRVLQDALAARQSALDRARFAEQPAPGAARAESRVRPPDRAMAPIQVALPWRGPSAQAAPVRRVPDVRGLTVREAALTLHRGGFRVRLHGTGRVHTTRPAGGEEARAGTPIEVWAGAGDGLQAREARPGGGGD